MDNALERFRIGRSILKCVKKCSLRVGKLANIASKTTQINQREQNTVKLQQCTKAVDSYNP
eukprot:200608-Amphidinium_carterae.1